MVSVSYPLSSTFNITAFASGDRFYAGCSQGLLLEALTSLEFFALDVVNDAVMGMAASGNTVYALLSQGSILELLNGNLASFSTLPTGYIYTALDGFSASNGNFAICAASPESGITNSSGFVITPGSGIYALSGKNGSLLATNSGEIWQISVPSPTSGWSVAGSYALPSGLRLTGLSQGVSGACGYMPWGVGSGVTWCGGKEGELLTLSPNVSGGLLNVWNLTSLTQSFSGLGFSSGAVGAIVNDNTQFAIVDPASGRILFEGTPNQVLTVSGGISSSSVAVSPDSLALLITQGNALVPVTASGGVSWAQGSSIALPGPANFVAASGNYIVAGYASGVATLDYANGAFTLVGTFGLPQNALNGALDEDGNALIAGTSATYLVNSAGSVIASGQQTLGLLSYFWGDQFIGTNSGNTCEVVNYNTLTRSVNSLGTITLGSTPNYYFQGSMTNAPTGSSALNSFFDGKYLFLTNGNVLLPMFPYAPGNSPPAYFARTGWAATGLLSPSFSIFPPIQGWGTSIVADTSGNAIIGTSEGYMVTIAASGGVTSTQVFSGNIFFSQSAYPYAVGSYQGAIISP